jgi:NAD(P)-dependent dehydrogenase (short-subunit alcohol dehydrogenase family)
MSSSVRRSSVAIVTGAGRGIGKATAQALAREKWKVALLSRTRKELEASVSQIREQGGEAAYYVTDVSKYQAVTDTFNRICNSLGPPDCLINNAAVVLPVGPVITLDPVSWKKAVDINLLGAFNCAHAALERMAKVGRGSLLNMISGMGMRVFPGFSAYSVSKAGLILLTRILAEEVRPYGITVNAIDPGLVSTSMQETLRQMPSGKIGHEMFQRLERLYRDKLLKPPEIIGKWIAAFLSDKAWKITGEVGTLSDFEDRYGILSPSSKLNI